MLCFLERQAGANVAVRNLEGKSVVDIARAMNFTSNGVAGPVLFMVLMAAGLDPMAPAAPAAPEAPTSPPAAAENDNTQNANIDKDIWWVIIKDGFLVGSTAPPSGGRKGGTSERGAVSDGAGAHRVSKKLKFVRRSIFGGGVLFDDSRDRDKADYAKPPPANKGEHEEKAAVSVEVFRSKQHAEERVRNHHHYCNNSGRSVSGATEFTLSSSSATAAAPPTPSSSSAQLQPSPLFGAKIASPWGAASASSKNIGSSSAGGANDDSDGKLGDSSPYPSQPLPLSNATSFPNTNPNTNTPCAPCDVAVGASTGYQTACIDPARKDEFMKRVPAYHFPFEKSASATTKDSHNGLLRATHRIIEDEDDPMWSAFKRTNTGSSNRKSTNNNTTSATFSYNGRKVAGGDDNLGANITGSGGSFNKPVRLQSFSVPATNTTPTRSSDGSSSSSTSSVGMIITPPVPPVHLRPLAPLRDLRDVDAATPRSGTSAGERTPPPGARHPGQGSDHKQVAALCSSPTGKSYLTLVEEEAELRALVQKESQEVHNFSIISYLYSYSYPIIPCNMATS
jgi:hypothetical protein